MGEFFDKLEAASDELNLIDFGLVKTLGDTVFDRSDEEAIRELWPDAQPMLEGVEVGILLELVHDRGGAAKYRGAQRAAEFIEFVTDRLVALIKKGAAEQGQTDP